MSTLKRDDLYARFENLFMEFFGSPASFEIVIEPDEFRRLFYYSWDKKVPPSKEILMKAVHIRPTSLISLDEVRDRVADTFATALEKLRIEEHKQDEKRDKESIAKFPSPPGCRWEDVTIAFISDNDIRVEAKGLAEQYSYDEIEFEDKRAGGKRKLWFVLRALAMLGGRATVDNLIPASKAESLVSKDIQLLRKILYKLMGIKGDPFYHTKKGGDYQTKFTLRDERMVRDHKEPEADGLQEGYSEDLNPKWLKS